MASSFCAITPKYFMIGTMAPTPPLVSWPLLFIWILLHSCHFNKEAWGISDRILSRRGSSLSLSFSGRRKSRVLPSFANNMEWDISRKAGYPKFSFDADSLNDEVVLQFEVTGTNSSDFAVQKSIRTSVLLPDCISQTSTTPAILVDDAVDATLGLYTVYLNVVQGSIASSDYYSLVNETFAYLYFCVRVDYLVYMDNADQIVNYYDTNITLGIDLTDSYSLASVLVSEKQVDQQQATIQVDYPIQAYFCDDNNTLLTPAPALEPGQSLQFCVQLDPFLQGEDVYVSNMTNVRLSQASSGQTSQVISDGTPDALTSFDCHSGVCNIKSFLLSKWFTTSITPDSGNAFDTPEAVNITGEVLLLFGLPARGRERRQLGTKLATSSAVSRFALQALLLSTQRMDRHDDSSTSNVWPWAVVTALAISILLGLLFVTVFQDRLRDALARPPARVLDVDGCHVTVDPSSEWGEQQDGCIKESALQPLHLSNKSPLI